MYSILLIFVVIIFLKLFKMATGMTFWDYIYNISKKTKIVIVTIFSLFCMTSLYFYKYIPDLKDLNWYFLGCMMIMVSVIYYLLFISWTWLCLDIFEWNKDINTTEEKYLFFGITSFIEAMIFAGIAYLFIESAKIFWIWFFGLQIYRILFLGTIKIYISFKKT